MPTNYETRERMKVNQICDVGYSGLGDLEMGNEMLGVRMEDGM